MGQRCAHGSWYIQGTGRLRTCTHCGQQQARESVLAEWTDATAGAATAGAAVAETLNPADEPLTLLEETVLLVLARGEFMAPIGRWGDTLQGLTQRGLAERRDEMNYVITPRGRQVAEAKDDRFVRGWINDSNRAALSRRGLPAAMRTVGDDYAKMQDDGAQTGDYDRLTGSPVNETFIERVSVTAADVERNGGKIEADMAEMLRKDVSRFSGIMAAPAGCVCPPTSEQTCQNPLCPRKAPPAAR